MKVSVLMPTYNHANYISQSIDSFLQQCCDFDIELIVGDDCSTDGTREIVEGYVAKYPEKIILISSNTNRGLLRNYKSVIERAKGDYFAILESDDYWIDSQKLQKQIDFLERNKEYGLINTSYEVIDDLGINIGRHKGTSLTNGTYESLIWGNVIGAVTVCFSRELYEKYCNIDEYIRLEFKTFDLPVWLSLSAHSKVYGFVDVTAVYRKVITSISNNCSWEKSEQFNDSIDLIIDYIISKYGMGVLSDDDLLNSKMYRRVSEAIDRDKYQYVLFYSKKIICKDLRMFMVRYAPFFLYVLKKKWKIFQSLYRVLSSIFKHLS